MTKRLIVTPGGYVLANGRSYRCALGRGGIKRDKREGDGATPVGLWHPVEIRYRAGRVYLPRTHLPIQAIRPNDGWCDAATDPRYNQPVQHPFRSSAERMWRTDHLYDLVVVLDHNTGPIIPGGGSAVFMHVARPDYGPTEGCVALALPDLRRLVWRMTLHTKIEVVGD